MKLENEYDLTPLALDLLRHSKRMSKTLIEWTGGGFVWNVCTGCTGAFGAGKPCEYCYANKKANNPYFRKAFPNKFTVTYHADRLLQPLKEKKPAIIFADSMSDLFCNGVKPKWTQDIFDVIDIARQHWFVILTKSPENLEKYLYGLESGFYLSGGDYVENVFIGVSVDRADAVHRIKTLQKFKEDSGGGWHLMVSFEPLLEKMPDDINLDEIEWVIIGQRTKPENDPPYEWIGSLGHQAYNHNPYIPVFHKDNIIHHFPRENWEVLQEYPKPLVNLLKRRKKYG